jgi:hypothetical protein
MNSRSIKRLLLGPALLGLLAGPIGRGVTPARSAERQSGQPETNACGCYRDSVGMCVCLRQSRCGCPGVCEPLGCEEQRQKDLARRMEEELKRIRDEERARQEQRDASAGTDAGVVQGEGRPDRSRAPSTDRGGSN